jgi:DNA helicase-2/ATP-dependent DNA helicase PcrA
MDYTDAQKEAIGCLDSNLHIIACAGSGKTQVLAARIVEILKEKRVEGIGPENIVAFTFTDKAAAELKDRVYRLAREELGEITGMAEMFVGTIHGYCLHILQTYLFKYLKYAVLSEVQSRLLVARNSQKSGLKDVKVVRGPAIGQPLRRNPQDVGVFLDALNVLREDNVDRGRVPVELWGALRKYTDLLDQHRYLDYSRIMLEAKQALADEGDEAVVRLQKVIGERVKYLIVDEYQDVNPLQEAIIRRIQQLGANLCVVGDDDQTIYQWRGSEIANILRFADRYPGVQSVTLAENFRSSQGVVGSGRRVAELNNPSRLSKAMVATSHQMFERGDLLAIDFTDPVAEAHWIAHRIQAVQGLPFVDYQGADPRGLTYSDCAILLRSVRNNGAVISQALDEAGIPYVVGGLANLFDRPEVQAAVGIFLYMVRQLDEAGLREVWQVANLGVTGDDLTAGIAVLNEARTFEAGKRWGAYNIQRTYLRFLEAVCLREERVPPTAAGAARGEVVLYNLGKFSEVITDFEVIHFKSAPEEKYESFAWWVTREAPGYYEEGGGDVGYAQPDAVQIMTVHQAKGMEWPVVFVPALIRNRFPSTVGTRGRSKWHILPQAAVPDYQRYDGSVADERRLFYVALTRSKKYLYCTYAPIATNQLFRRRSRFMQEFSASEYVLTREVPLPDVARLEPRARRDVANVVFSFSDLKYLFECPYQFKLRFLYGFNPPLHEALGYGKSLHDALAEVHKRALDGEIMGPEDAEVLIDQHMHTPYAAPDLADQLKNAGVEAIKRYLKENGASLAQTRHSEQQVEILVIPGITVNGRIDLIKRLDTDEVSIVDFKSSERAQAEDVTRLQLHTYAMGYRQLKGEDADLVEIHNLDEKGKNVRELVDGAMMAATQEAIRRAGDALRDRNLPRLGAWCDSCAGCDLVGICRTRPAAT